MNAVPDVVIPGETGLLVPPERPDLLADALDFALRHPETGRRLAARARERLGSRYDVETGGDILDEVYSLKSAGRRRGRRGLGALVGAGSHG